MLPTGMATSSVPINGVGLRQKNVGNFPLLLERRGRLSGSLEMLKPAQTAPAQKADDVPVWVPANPIGRCYRYECSNLLILVAV
jgi:hypothetical protein